LFLDRFEKLGGILAVLHGKPVPALHFPTESAIHGVSLV
jgi:hypothetical protein